MPRRPRHWGVRLRDLKGAAAALGGSRGAAAIVATLAALRFRETRAGEVRDEWRLLAEKAERWLATALASRQAAARAAVEQAVAVLLA